MFKTFSLCALLAIASANEPTEGDKKEDTTPKMVAMTAEEITTACTANMTELCGALEAGNKLMSPADDTEEICEAGGEIATGGVEAACTEAGKIIAGGVATPDEEGSASGVTMKKDMEDV